MNGLHHPSLQDSDARRKSSTQATEENSQNAGRQPDASHISSSRHTDQTSCTITADGGVLICDAPLEQHHHELHEPLTLPAFLDAHTRVMQVTRPTNLIESVHFSTSTNNRVFLKPENMQRTGSYKVRGSFYKISSLTPEARSKGLVAASAGNHAQGVAYAASRYGVPATIVMPTTTPLMKVERTKKHGAQVVLHGEVYDEAYEHARHLEQEHGYTFIHPFDDLEVATGQGTIALEILEDLPQTDVILVPIGGGGLSAGVATATKLINPSIRVIGVEPAGAASMRAAREAGRVVTLPSVSTIADGTAVKRVGEQIFPYVQRHLDDIITIEDDELIASFLDMVENHKMVVENSGLLTVAALNHLSKLGIAGKHVVSILSGGSMDVITMASVVQLGLIKRSRIFTISMQLPDRPGELVRATTAIAQQKGNVIRLDHNQFVNVNRLAAVELCVTIEAYGPEHKTEIIQGLADAGFDVREVQVHL